MALGETLRSARLAKGLTPAQVAEATRMMVQMVEEIEKEDFHRIAAPIYGKGFIRLFAEQVGLPAEPLVREYIECHVGAETSERGRLLSREVVPPPPRPSQTPSAPTLSAAAVAPDELDSLNQTAPPSAPPSADDAFALTADAVEPEPDLFARSEPDAARRNRLADLSHAVLAWHRRRQPEWSAALRSVWSPVRLRLRAMAASPDTAGLAGVKRLPLWLLGLLLLAGLALLIGLRGRSDTGRDPGLPIHPPTADYARIIPPPPPYID